MDRGPPDVPIRNIPQPSFAPHSYHHHQPTQPSMPVHGQLSPNIDRRQPDQEPPSALQDPHNDYDSQRPVQHFYNASKSILAPPQPTSTSHLSAPPSTCGDSQWRNKSCKNGGLPLTPGGYETPTHQAVPTPAAHLATGSQKKPMRASIACDQCRQLKAKCDETKPCKTCRDKGCECIYTGPALKAHEMRHAEIMEGITMMGNTLSNLTGEFGRINKRMRKMEKAVTNSLATAPPLGAVSVITREEYHASVAASSPLPAEKAGEYSVNKQIPMMAEDELEAEPGPPVTPAEPAIAINRTSLTGLPLGWPGIKERTKHLLEQAGVKFISEFPINQEKSRGHLIAYARGENSHLSRDASKSLSHDVASLSPAADYDQLCGKPVEYHGDVLASDGNPDFSESKVWEYVASFKENILNMHPIIPTKELDNLVRQFLHLLPRTHLRPPKRHPSDPTLASTIAAVHTPPEMTGNKRKRSAVSYGFDGPETPAPIGTALVLTVLALGKFCQHRSSIPDAVPSAYPPPQISPVTQNGIPSPPSQDSPQPHGYFNSSGLPSPKEPQDGYQSGTSYIPTSGCRGNYKKNCYIIPGLQYFDLAANILGNHTVDNVDYVYANIFAGLYHGQLCRPLESFNFIRQARCKLKAIMGPLNEILKRRENGVIKDGNDNRLVLAYWTCFQLESDLVAELQLSPSWLLSCEEEMPMPNMDILVGFESRVLFSYVDHVHLTRAQNSIRRMFYGPDDAANDWAVEVDWYQNVSALADNITSLKSATSSSLTEVILQAEDILGARLRARFWGAQVIAYRPVIKQFLQLPGPIKNALYRARNITSSESLIVDFQFIMKLVEEGVKALIECTRAFHCLGSSNRPIITDMFGTAQAQWGNLLVLSAIFKDAVLKNLVDEDLLRTLFDHTIRFLQQSATVTSSLKTHLHILEGLQRDLFNTVS